MRQRVSSRSTPPQSLVEAHRDGSLVLFVGAGASKDHPSSLPDFWGLAAEIAEELHQPWPRTDDVADRVAEFLDRIEGRPDGFDEGISSVRRLLRAYRDTAKPEDFFGRLDDEPDVNVHKWVVDRIQQSPEPNLLHRRIAALADSGEKLRMVTTNFDLHLTTALKDAGACFEEFQGPALPLGDDFEGLVYLHGNISQPPERLVVTDKDFAAAYLQDARAARFLERMFRKYTVLFVGYSHSDTMMYHIGRALSSDNDRRYALVGESGLDRDYWERRLGIKPVTYEVIGDSHERLGEAIERWADQAAMGLTDHRERVRNLVTSTGPPSQEPDDVSYLEETIAHPERVQFFVEFARDRKWLEWVAGQHSFQQIFNPNLLSPEALADGLRIVGADSENAEPALYKSLGVTEALAGWFAEHYALNPEHYTQTQNGMENALSIAGANGGRLSRPLWNSLRHHLPEDLSPGWARSWVLQLLRDAPERGFEGLSYALPRLQWPRDRVMAMVLFDSLTEPRRHPGKVG